MIGLDTNVLVRYLVQDDPIQSKQATQLFERRCSADDPGCINLVVLCETVWVLTRAYGFERSTIADVIEKLLEAVEIAMESDDVVRAALRLYRGARVDFADIVIGVHNQRLGCSHTATFDRDTLRVSGFRLVS